MKVGQPVTVGHYYYRVKPYNGKIVTLYTIEVARTPVEHQCR